MGYYTNYELTVSDGCDDLHAAAIAEISGYRTLEESVKWYDHEAHLRAYSKLHPGVTFTRELTDRAEKAETEIATLRARLDGADRG